MKIRELLVRDNFNFPNLLTLFRICIIPFLCYVLYKYHITQAFNYLIFIWILGWLIIISDITDGLISRLLQQETILGSLLDPLADKIGVFSISIVLMIYYGLPFWFIIIFFIKEFIFITASIFFFYKKDFVFRSVIWSKITVLLFPFIVLAYVFDLPYKVLTVYISIGLMIVTLFTVTLKAIRFWLPRK